MLKTIRPAIYPVEIVLSTDTKSSLKYLDEVGMLTPELADDISFSDAFVKPLVRCYKNGQQSEFLLLSFTNLKTAKDASILVHELTHVKSFICEFLGLRCDTDNDEWEAYLNQYLFQLFTDVIKGKERPEIEVNKEKK